MSNDRRFASRLGFSTTPSLPAGERPCRARGEFGSAAEPCNQSSSNSEFVREISGSPVFFFLPKKLLMPLDAVVSDHLEILGNVEEPDSRLSLPFPGVNSWLVATGGVCL